jgi:hypothetical protein
MSETTTPACRVFRYGDHTFVRLVMDEIVVS